MAASPVSESILRFLELEDEDFDFLDRYRPLLQRDATSFAEGFYEYLLGQPETASILRNLSGTAFKDLLRKQARHFERLLTDRFDSPYQEDIRRVGQIHHRRGIAPVWITGAYARYWEYLDTLSASPEVLPGDRLRLREILSKSIFADLCLQLEGYAGAQSEDDAIRAALARALVNTLLAERSGPTWDRLLRRICQGLVSADTHILASWSAVGESGTLGLALTPYLGSYEDHPPAVCLPQNPDDPCWRALGSGEPVILTGVQAAAPDWMAGSLPPGCGEIGFFPFGSSKKAYAGVAILAADSENFFRRIGFERFTAFSHFADLLLDLRDQSLRDPLTGLPNRTLFHDRMTHALSGVERREHLLAVGVLDLDGFKLVNDQYGHAAGDALLQQVASRLRGAMRPRDTLARLGGDEFGLLLDELENVQQLESLMDRLLDALRLPFTVEHRTLALSASLGFTLHPLDDGDADTLVRHADKALYASKQAGGDRSIVYSTEMSEEAKWHSRISRELRHAVSHRELLLHYQPQVNMNTGAVVGVEALLRWQHPERGLLAPGEFMDALEDGPVSRRIGRHVLDKALAQLVAWQKQGISLRVAVNIGAHHLLAPEFIEDLRHALTTHAVAPERLEIEVTETTAIADLAAARDILAACRNFGVSVALDDFGTGNAPLSYLQSLPANTVKVDRGFVKDILDNPRDAAIVAGVVTSARLLGLEVVAEGVESSEHGCLLMQLGCKFAQGYLIAKPMRGEAIPAWIAAYAGNPVWASCSSQIWRPENYGLLMISLSHAQRARQTQALLADPHAPIPEHLLDPDSVRTCILGRWLEEEGKSRFGDHPRFRSIKDLHDQLHEAAREAALLKQEGTGVGTRAVKKKVDDIRRLSEAIQQQFADWLRANHTTIQ